MPIEKDIEIAPEDSPDGILAKKILKLITEGHSQSPTEPLFFISNNSCLVGTQALSSMALVGNRIPMLEMLYRAMLENPQVEDIIMSCAARFLDEEVPKRMMKHVDGDMMMRAVKPGEA